MYTLAGWPRRTTLTPISTKPSTMLSTAALVSAQARMGAKGKVKLGVLTITSMNASSVLVLPVPGGPCTPAYSCMTSWKQAKCCVIVLCYESSVKQLG